MNREQELQDYLSYVLYEQGLRFRNLGLETVLQALEEQAQRWLNVQCLDANSFTGERVKILAVSAMCDVGMSVN